MRPIKINITNCFFSPKKNCRHAPLSCLCIKQLKQVTGLSVIRFMFQKCESCEILPPAPAQFADSSPEEMNKVIPIWETTFNLSTYQVSRNEQGPHLINQFFLKHACVCVWRWLICHFRAQIMWWWRSTWRWQDFDSSTSKMGRSHPLDVCEEHFICVQIPISE